MFDNESSPSCVLSLAIKLSGIDNYPKWRFQAEVPLKDYHALDIVKCITTEAAHHGSPL